MDEISKTVKDLVQMSYDAKVEAKTTCRFSVDVSWEDNRRLSYITKKLGMSKSSVVSELVHSALFEFEVELGIVNTAEELKNNVLEKSLKYQSWISSNDPVPDFSDDIQDLKFIVKDYRGERELIKQGVNEDE